ncbi:MAG: HEAT repeat domain-containing protein [Planctomycetota bacterium]|jgi:HEAT repeat protein
MRATVFLALLLWGCGEGEPTYIDKPATEWAAGITSPDEDARTQAIALLKRDGASAAPMLAALLRFDDRIVRRAALRVLQGMRLSKLPDADMGPFLAPLREALTFYESRTQEWALDHLVRIGPPAAEAVASAIDFPDPHVRAKAAWALSRCGAGGVPALIAALDDESETVLAEALGSLTVLGAIAADAAPRLAEQLEADDLYWRCRAAIALARVDPGNEKALDILVELLGAEDAMVREGAATGLAMLAKAAMPKLVAALGHADDSIRYMACLALGRMDPAAEPAVAALRKTLEGDEPPIKVQAAFALARILPEDEAAVNGLADLLGHENARVAGSAAAALDDLGERAVPALVAVLETDSEAARGLAALTLAGMGRTAHQALPALRRLLEHESATLRVQAAFAVWTLDEDAATTAPVLVGALVADEETRRRAVEILWEIGPRAEGVVSDLLTLVIDGEPDVRPAAALLLGRMGKAARKTRATLEEILAVENDRRLTEAIERALKKIPR